MKTYQHIDIVHYESILKKHINLFLNLNFVIYFYLSTFLKTLFVNNKYLYFLNFYYNKYFHL